MEGRQLTLDEVIKDCEDEQLRESKNREAQRAGEKEEGS